MIQRLIVFEAVLITGFLVILLFEHFHKRTWINRKGSSFLTGMQEAVKRVKPLYLLQQRVAEKLAITNTALKQENEIYALSVMGVFLLASALFFVLTLSYAKIWYIFLLNLTMSLIIPFLIFNMYYDFMVKRLIKQLPEAIDEFCSSYRRYNKIYHALRDSYPNMPRMIAKEFERLYKSYSVNFEEGLEYFRGRVKNEWASIFVSLLLINHTQGGNITDQLDDLNSEIENAIVSKDKTSSKMLGFKLISLSGVLLVVIAIRANIAMSEVAWEYYNTPDGMNGIALTITVAVITFIGASVVEKL